MLINKAHNDDSTRDRARRWMGRKETIDRPGSKIEIETHDDAFGNGRYQEVVGVVVVVVGGGALVSDMSTVSKVQVQE